MFALWGAKLEAGETMPAPEIEEEIEMQRALKAFVAANPGYLTKTVKAIKGVSEETTTGVHRLYHIAKKRSEEHTSELQSLMRSSYAVFCLKKKKKTQKSTTHPHRAPVNLIIIPFYTIHHN